MPSLLIEAGPGCGKTTTVSFITTYLRATNRDVWWRQHKRLTDEQRNIITWCDKNLPTDKSMIGMAYNKEAAANLNSQTHQSVECRTVHGWGYKTILSHKNYVPINDGAGLSIIEKVTGKPLNSLKDKYQWLSANRFFEKLKDELLQPTTENLLYLSQKYDDLASFKFDDTTATKIRQLMPLHKQIDKQRGITYIDQVWLACFLLKEPEYDTAIIDECQDISSARRFLANKIASNKLWIGDRYQSINAFAGADSHSIDNIIALGVDQLPLKTSFRNPPNIIDRLNKLRPLAKLRGLDKPPGKEERIELEEYAKSVAENYPSTTLTVCRTNAPLIRAAYALLEANIPCRILGDRVVDQLCKIIKNQMAPSMSDFLAKLKRYENIISNNLDPYIAEAFSDKINCIRLVADKVSSPEDIVGHLRKLFKPSGEDYATLCTIHKAKGLEAPNVYILFPPIQSTMAKTPEQKEQETNLVYVAESRTSNNLYWVV
jgi:superfamily I DNA/RNA helicase